MPCDGTATGVEDDGGTTATLDALIERERAALYALLEGRMLPLLVRRRLLSVEASVSGGAAPGPGAPAAPPPPGTDPVAPAWPDPDPVPAEAGEGACPDRAGTPATRPSVEAAAIAVLEGAGAPMHVSALTERVKDLRATRRSIRFRPGLRLCLVDHETWGLADRDVRLRRTARSGLMHAARREVAAGNLTIAGLHEALADRCRDSRVGNPALLATLLRLDLGYAFTHAGAIRTDRHSQVREGSLRAALTGILRERPAGILRSDMSRLVEERTGTLPSDAQVSSTLRDIGLRISSRLWTLAVPAGPDGPGPEGHARKPWVYPAKRRKAAPKGDPFDWTPEREEALRAMVAEGFRTKQIRQALGGGVTRGAVLGKVDRMGLSPTRPPRKFGS